MQDSIFGEFYERIKHVAVFSFVLYFLVVVIVLGGAGVWIPVIQDCKLGMSSLSNNMMTYSCSLMAPSAISLLLSFLKYKHKVWCLLYSWQHYLSFYLLVTRLYQQILWDWR